MQKFTNLREIIQDEENNYIFERLHRQCLWRRNCGQRQCRGRGGGGVALTKSPKLFPLVILQPIKPFPHLALLCIYKSCFINWKLENVLWLWTLTGQLSFQGKKSLIRKAKGSIFFASESFFKAFHQNQWNNKIVKLTMMTTIILKRLMFRMHFIMSQLVQRSKHKGTNFATPKHKSVKIVTMRKNIPCFKIMCQNSDSQNIARIANAVQCHN